MQIVFNTLAAIVHIQNRVWCEPNVPWDRPANSLQREKFGANLMFLGIDRQWDRRGLVRRVKYRSLLLSSVWTYDILLLLPLPYRRWPTGGGGLTAMVCDDVITRVWSTTTLLGCSMMIRVLSFTHRRISFHPKFWIASLFKIIYELGKI